MSVNQGLQTGDHTGQIQPQTCVEIRPFREQILWDSFCRAYSLDSCDSHCPTSHELHQVSLCEYLAGLAFGSM